MGEASIDASQKLNLEREASTDASQKLNLEEEAQTENDIVKEYEPKIGTDVGSNLNEKDKGKKKVDKPRISFPLALKPSSSSKNQGTRNEELIKLPLLDVTQHVLAYTKFLKELYTQEHEPQITKKVVLSKNVNAILLNQLPQKMKDPGAPLISCAIGDITFDQALLDLGASVNLLPTSVYEKFRIGELKPTSTILQLADKSMKTPRGLIKDVLVRVNQCYFSIDFLILDMEPSQELNQNPIILGHPFLATANANINCKTGAMDISFRDQKVKINIFNNSKLMQEEESCYVIEMIDEPIESDFFSNSMDDSELMIMILDPIKVPAPD